MSEYNYPDELIKQAQLRIQKQLEGNSLDVNEIPITIKRQGIGKFTAKTSFTIDCKVETRQEKGKQNIGRIVGDGQLQTEIKKFITDYENKDSIESTGIELIKNLQLYGFGSNKEILQLQGGQETLTEHQTCRKCSGQGKSQCHICHSKGRMRCNMCSGQGLLRCQFCKGLGQTQAGNQKQLCRNCQGKGQQYCTPCQGQKTIACTHCQSKGSINCVDCSGQGHHSVIATISPVLKTHADFNVQELENDPKRMINKIGSLILAKGKHIKINVIQQPIEEAKEHAYFEKEEDSKIKNSIFYEATIPWAVGELTHKDKKHEITFAGFKGAICENSDFMDQVLIKPLNLLKNAAKGKGYVAGLLKDACKYRVSRETLSYVAQGSKKKAMMSLQKTYSIGTSQNTIKSFVINGFNALKRITRRPRYIGLATGLLVSFGIYYSWFINNLRDNTSQYEPLIRYIMDSTPLIFGIIITIMAIKHAGNFTLKSVMKSIGVQNSKMPPVGTAGIYAVILNIALWGILFSNLFLNFY